MGQRRLRDEQVACSIRQVLVFRNGKNVLQMFNFHFQIILSNLLIPNIYYRIFWGNFKEYTVPFVYKNNLYRYEGDR